MADMLETPPPPPGQVGGQPQAGALQQMGQQNPSGDGGSIKLATQHLQEAEQALRAAVKVKPELAQIVDGFINQFKPQAGNILFGQQQQGQGQMPQPGVGSLLTSGAAPGLNVGM